MSAPFTKVLFPGTVPFGIARRIPVFAKVDYDGTRLSFTGVEGPRANGDASGSCGQIAMGYKHRDPADDDSRCDSPTGPDEIEFADGWDADLWLDFLDAWQRWHLNDMRPECEHQRALGWTYETHRDPESNYAGLPCPVCGYRIGSAWLHEDVPADVIALLRSLPDADRIPAWV